MTACSARRLTAFAAAALVVGTAADAASLSFATPAVADVTATPPSDRTLGATRPNNVYYDMPAYRGQCTDGAERKVYDAAGYYLAVNGSAKQWADQARAGNWTVVDDPQPRSVVVFEPGVQGADGSYGHVAWVDAVSQRPDGPYVDVTEMNNSQLGGVGAFSARTVKAVKGMSYILIP
jgi:surface antigen